MAEGNSTGVPPERLCSDLNVSAVSAAFPGEPLQVTDAHVTNGEVYCRWGGLDTGFIVSSDGQSTDDGYRYFVTSGIGYSDAGTIGGVQDGQIYTFREDADGYGKARSGIAFLVQIRGKGITGSPVDAARKLAQLVSDVLEPTSVSLVELSGCELPPIGTECSARAH
jgi:hypothetical protein